MKPPVLVVATPHGARALRSAFEDEFELVLATSEATARPLAATGAFLAIVADPALPGTVMGAISLDLGADAAPLRATLRAEVARRAAVQRDEARGDDVGMLAYDRFLELARYAFTRRYLMALLDRHKGSVTDAARGADMKRESLHRLLRKHHLVADDFRERS